MRPQLDCQNMAEQLQKLPSEMLSQQAATAPLANDRFRIFMKKAGPGSNSRVGSNPPPAARPESRVASAQAAPAQLPQKIKIKGLLQHMKHAAVALPGSSTVAGSSTAAKHCRDDTAAAPSGLAQLVLPAVEIEKPGMLSYSGVAADRQQNAGSAAGGLMAPRQLPAIGSKRRLARETTPRNAFHGIYKAAAAAVEGTKEEDDDQRGEYVEGHLPYRAYSAANVGHCLVQHSAGVFINAPNKALQRQAAAAPAAAHYGEEPPAAAALQTEDLGAHRRLRSRNDATESACQAAAMIEDGSEHSSPGRQAAKGAAAIADVVDPGKAWVPQEAMQTAAVAAAEATAADDAVESACHATAATRFYGVVYKADHEQLQQLAQGGRHLEETGTCTVQQLYDEVLNTAQQHGLTTQLLEVADHGYDNHWRAITKQWAAIVEVKKGSWDWSKEANNMTTESSVYGTPAAVHDKLPRNAVLSLCVRLIHGTGLKPDGLKMKHAEKLKLPQTLRSDERYKKACQQLHLASPQECQLQLAAALKWVLDKFNRTPVAWGPLMSALQPKAVPPDVPKRLLAQ